MDHDKSTQGRRVFSLPPSLAAKAKKGSILYFWQEQLVQLNKNYDDFLAQYSEEHKWETSRYFGGEDSEVVASPESSDDTGSTSYAESNHDDSLLDVTDKSKTTEAQQLHWSSMLNQLALYKLNTGHCNVPSSYKEDKALGEWVKLQRAAAKAGRLSPEHREALDGLGFKWVVHSMNSHQIEASWRTMLESLVEYKRKHGDCLVPQRYEENIALGMSLFVENVESSGNLICFGTCCRRGRLG